MILSEGYKNRLLELAGLKSLATSILEEAAEAIEDLYQNSDKRVKFDQNLMKQAIEGGMEIGMIFQSNNSKYIMPIWKTRIVQPVAMGYDRKGNLIVRGVHVEGQSEKKAIETGVRSAQAKNEWRLFKMSNLKSMFFTGRLFTEVGLPGYNPNDSAMSRIVASFNSAKAKAYQNTLNKTKEKTMKEPVAKPAPVQKKPVVQKQPITAKPAPIKKAPVVTPAKPSTPKVSPVKPVDTKSKENTKKLQQKIDKLTKFK